MAQLLSALLSKSYEFSPTSLGLSLRDRVLSYHGSLRGSGPKNDHGRATLSLDTSRAPSRWSLAILHDQSLTTRILSIRWDKIPVHEHPLVYQQ